ncbi:hypothetical protein ACIPRI_16445 [Variovorax sp. LARHSF232]
MNTTLSCPRVAPPRSTAPPGDKRRLLSVFLLMACAGWASNAAHAQASASSETRAGDWRYSLSVYGYLPSISGSSSVPTSPGGPTLDVSASKIVDSLKFTFMGAFDAHNGRWGVFTDFIYLDLGNTQQGSRDFTIGHQAIPANTSADLSWDLKGVLWTVGGQYRLASDARLTVDALAGARLLSMKPSLAWNIHGDLGPISTAGRTGSSEASETLWDGIVGAKGRYVPSDSGKWSLPFYVDVGTGQSRLTWQAAAGVSYAFSWGELTGMWRHIDYDMKSNSGPLEDLRFDGPMLGATFRW